MAGHVISIYLKDLGKYDVIDVVYRTKIDGKSIIIDIRDNEKLEKVIQEQNPNYIINCIGILIKGSQHSADNAIYINSYLPHLLVKIARKVNAKLIHISTDCVFSGKKGDYYEDDFRDADDVYGRSKALGEIENDIDLTIRTSIIGPELKNNGEGLFHWFMMQKGIIHGYTNAYWSGVTTLELAAAIDASIEQNITGLIHLTNEIKISKFDLLRFIKQIFNKIDVDIIPIETVRSDKNILIKRNILKFNVQDYKKMISEMKKFMDLNHNYYSQYLD